ncbi:MAG: phage holin [Clostridium sp.]|nr:phage holin [Clostridium sp.]
MKVKSSDVQTYVRTFLLFLAFLNQGLTMAGKSPLPINDEEVEEAVSLGFTISTSIWAWWKNNSFTQAAKKADTAMQVHKLKKLLDEPQNTTAAQISADDTIVQNSDGSVIQESTAVASVQAPSYVTGETAVVSDRLRVTASPDHANIMFTIRAIPGIGKGKVQDDQTSV